MKKFSIALIAVSAFAADKRAPLPKALPAYGPLPAFHMTDVQERKLPNGLTIWLAPENDVPKVTITLAVKGGYAADPKDKTGLADLLAQALSEGTKTRSAKQIAEQIQACGGDLFTQADADSVSLQTNVLTEKAADALAIVADVVQNASFADSEVQIVKKNASSALESNEADPSFIARSALYKAIYGDHPYATVTAPKEVIEKVTGAELRAQYAAEFAPSRAILVLTGNFDPAKLGETAATAFGNWNASASTPEEAPEPQPNVSRAVVLVPRPNSVQTGFLIGEPVPPVKSPDYPSLQLANAIYGGMFGSRLVLNIREDKGYTYSPGARIAANGRGALLTTQAEVRNDVTGPSFNEITYELNRMATTAPEPTEVDEAKRYLTGMNIIRLQSYASLGSRLGEYWVWELKPSDISRIMSGVQSASIADVQAAGAKYFPAYHMTVVAVGDEQVIRNQLAPFGVEFKKAQ